MDLIFELIVSFLPITSKFRSWPSGDANVFGGKGTSV